MWLIEDLKRNAEVLAVKSGKMQNTIIKYGISFQKISPLSKSVQLNNKTMLTKHSKLFIQRGINENDT